MITIFLCWHKLLFLLFAIIWLSICGLDRQDGKLLFCVSYFNLRRHTLKRYFEISPLVLTLLPSFQSITNKSPSDEQKITELSPLKGNRGLKFYCCQKLGKRNNQFTCSSNRQENSEIAFIVSLFFYYFKFLWYFRLANLIASR